MEKALMSIDEKINSLDKVLDSGDKFLKISTRASSSGEIIKFNVLDDDKLQKVADRMVAIDRATTSFGKSNTQTTSKLMSLTMLSPAGTPYQQIKQILAQIERKRTAIKEAYIKIKRQKVELKKLERDLAITEDDLDKEDILIDIEETLSNISDSILYFEGALKEIGQYQETYDEIIRNNNIPEDWDEKDMELSEIEHHVKSAFRLGLRDIINHNSLGMGTLEYLEQYGINPISADKFIRDYVNTQKAKLNKQSTPTYDDHMNFLNEMFNIHKDCYKDAMKRMGIDNLINEEFLYLEKNKENIMEEK
jgi:hypothetical protein